MSAPVSFSFDQAPEDAVKYLASKGLHLSFNYDEMMHEAHHKAFTVAKVTKLDLLGDIHQSLVDAQRNGTTFEQWKRDIKPTLQKKGWWGKTSVTNPKTGETKEIYVGSRRLRTIFDTNMRVSYSVGRHKQLMSLTDAVYWRYTARLDGNTRPTHAAKDGIVKHRDDLWWRVNYPPNAWNCRCKVRAYRKDEIEAKGWKIHGGNLGNIASKDWAYDVGAGSGFEGLWKQKVSGLGCGDFADRPCAKALYELAKRETIVDAARFRKWFKYPKGDFTIASMPPKMRKATGAKTHEIRISKESLGKNVDHHPELEWYEYLLINHIVAKNDMAVLKDGRIVVAVKGLEGALYLAVLKTTAAKKEVYVTSFRKTDEEDVARELAKGKKL